MYVCAHNPYTDSSTDLASPPITAPTSYRNYTRVTAMVRLHVLQLAVCAALVAVCDAGKGAKCSAVLCSGVSISDPNTILVSLRPPLADIRSPCSTVAASRHIATPMMPCTKRRMIPVAA